MFVSFHLHPALSGSVEVECSPFGPMLVLDCEGVSAAIFTPTVEHPADAVPFARALHQATGEFLAAVEAHAIADLDPETGTDQAA